jgi:hypothetical protein
MTDPRPPRRARATTWPALALAALLLAPAREAGAQVGIYYPYSPGVVNFPIVDFGTVNFGTVNFGTVNFGTVNFPLVNPLGPDPYYNNYYWYNNPYAYWDTLAAADMYRASKFAMAGARYNVAANSMATNNVAANLVNQGEYRMMLQRRAASAGKRAGARFDVASGRPTLGGGGRAGTSRLVDITTKEGDVLWPLTAPAGGDLYEKRRAAGQAVRAVVQTFQKDGQVPVGDVIDALKAVLAYTEPASEFLRKNRPDDAAAFGDFVASLDRGLRLLASGPIPGGDGEAAGDPKSP